MTDEDRTHEDAEKDEMSEEPAEESADDAEAPPDEEPTISEEAGFGAEPPVDTDVFDMLRAAIGLFAQEAWIALGVQARYGSSETGVDLHCARIAIDTTRMLIEQLGDEATDEERREFDQLLTNLRLNFVRRKSKSEEEGNAES